MELLSMSISLTAVLVSFFAALSVSYLAVQSFTTRYDYSETLTWSFGVARVFLGTASFLGVFTLAAFILS